MLPIVSIGMSVYNCEKTVAASIQSILNQTFRDWELIIIDDGSRDGTLTVAGQFDDPRIRIVDGQQNLGLPSRLNQAVQLSRGKYFARMDGDDIAYPERLAKQVSFLDQHPEVHLLATWMVAFKDDASLVGLRPAPASHAAICAHPWAGFPMAHPTWMGKIEWFRANPYWPDAVRMEDKELLFRTYAKSNFMPGRGAAGLPRKLTVVQEKLARQKELCPCSLERGRKPLQPDYRNAWHFRSSSASDG